LTNRRDFFRLFTNDKKDFIIYPPYLNSDSLDKCIECIDKPCVEVCEEDIIFISKENKVYIDFKYGGCSFCKECARVCELDVLSIKSPNRIDVDFQIDTSSCLAHNNIICSSCIEPCEDGAILFNGLFNPIIDSNRCSGCGFCYSRCPTEAITIHPK